MAELVDAADSKSAVRKDVQVRFLFRARATSKGVVFYLKYFFLSGFYKFSYVHKVTRQEFLCFGNNNFKGKSPCSKTFLSSYIEGFVFLLMPLVMRPDGGGI